MLFNCLCENTKGLCCTSPLFRQGKVAFFRALAFPLTSEVTVYSMRADGRSGAPGEVLAPSFRLLAEEILGGFLRC